jgi:hypothetical protein
MVGIKMKDALTKLGFVVFILIALVPTRLETEFVTEFYRRHPVVTVLVISVPVIGVGWWLRSQSEWKVKKPS